MSHLNVIRQELSRAVESEFSRLSKLEVTRKRNPYADFQFYQLMGDAQEFMFGPAVHREISEADVTSLLSANRMLNSIRNQLPWSLDVRLAQELAKGRHWTIECGSPAFVEIYTFREVTDLPKIKSIYYNFKTYLRITYV